MARSAAALLTAPALVLALISGCSSAGSDTAGPDGPTTTAPATGSPATAGAADPSAGCRADQPDAGRTEERVASGPDDRAYLRYVPVGIDADEPAPLVVDLTAYSPASMEEAFSGFTTPAPGGSVLADDEGFVVVAPEPTNGSGALLTWNYVGTEGWSDDQQFVTDLLDDVEADVCIDRSRVFLAGFAVGGVFASITACGQTERFAALATVAGLYSPPGCDPSKPLPVISFHGTGDRFIPFEGGIGSGPQDLPLSADTIEGLTFMSTRDGAVASSEAWADHDDCDAAPDRSSAAEGVTRLVWSGCADGTAVELYEIDGGEHTWPGSNGMGTYTSLLGPVSDQIDATPLIWAFFEAQTS